MVRYPTEKFIEDRDKWDEQLTILDKTWAYIENWHCAIDGGAYIGAWSLVLSEKFHTVYAFEPEPDNYDCLLKNTQSRGEISRRNYALSGSMEPLRMQHKGANHLTVMSPGGKYYPAVTIDSLNLTPGFIKLDIEGHELPVLEGAVETLERSKPVLCIELKFAKAPLKKRLHKLNYEMVLEQRPDSIWVHRC